MIINLFIFFFFNFSIIVKEGGKKYFSLILYQSILPPHKFFLNTLSKNVSLRVTIVQQIFNCLIYKVFQKCIFLLLLNDNFFYHLSNAFIYKIFLFKTFSNFVIINGYFDLNNFILCFVNTN